MKNINLETLIEWVELMQKCQEYGIPMEEVMKFIELNKQPKQLMARIYSEKN